MSEPHPATALHRLLAIMTRWRDPQSCCPWEKRQTLDSIEPCTLEETYEVLDTIARRDYVTCAPNWAICCFRWCFTPRSRMRKNDLIFPLSAMLLATNLSASIRTYSVMRRSLRRTIASSENG